MPLHPTVWDGPEECGLLLGPSLRVPDFRVTLDVPSSHYSAAQWGLTAGGIRGHFTEYLRAHEVRREDC